jgi:hypothetical protein
MSNHSPVHVTKKDLNLTKLPYLLVVAQIQKSDFSLCAHAILEIVLFRNVHQFFSLSESKEEISLIVDEKTIEKFPKSVLKLSPKKYYGFEISGPLGASSVGIIHGVAEPLASAGISIFYLSSYQTDYTLIAKDDLSRAMSCLSRHFTLKYDTNERDNELTNTEHIEFPSQKEERFKQQRKLNFHQREGLCLASIDKDEPFLLGSYILQLIFFPNKKEERFFSYHEANGVISLILPKSELEPLRQFGSDYIRVYDDEFARITIDDAPLGFDEYGIVDSIAGPLARNSISLFYVSTFNSAHVLVALDNATKAKIALQSHFDITLK